MNHGGHESRSKHIRWRLVGIVFCQFVLDGPTPRSRPGQTFTNVAEFSLQHLVWACQCLGWLRYENSDELTWPQVKHYISWGKTGESEKQALCELGFNLLRPYSVSALFDKRFHRLLIPMQFACERRKLN